MSEQDGHQYFSANCFNEVWTLLDQPDRTPEQDRLMAEMAHASLYHWLRRDDFEPRALAIGLWQVSRVSAVLGRVAEAQRYAAEALEVCEAEGDALGAFFHGYAHEAAARAFQLADDESAAAEHLERARRWLERVNDEGEHKLLAADLEDLAGDGDGAGEA